MNYLEGGGGHRKTRMEKRGASNFYFGGCIFGSKNVIGVLNEVDRDGFRTFRLGKTAQSLGRRNIVGAGDKPPTHFSTSTHARPGAQMINPKLVVTACCNRNILSGRGWKSPRT